jgi:hypothetical protein
MNILIIIRLIIFDCHLGVNCIIDKVILCNKLCKYFLYIILAISISLVLVTLEDE